MIATSRDSHLDFPLCGGFSANDTMNDNSLYTVRHLNSPEAGPVFFCSKVFGKLKQENFRETRAVDATQPLRGAKAQSFQKKKNGINTS